MEDAEGRGETRRPEQPRHSLLQRVGYGAVIALVVYSFLNLMARGICPVP
jgi:hypothetical protein